MLGQVADTQDLTAHTLSHYTYMYIYLFDVLFVCRFVVVAYVVRIGGDDCVARPGRAKLSGASQEKKKKKKKNVSRLIAV